MNNLDQVTPARLVADGIQTPQDLEALGAGEACRRRRERNSRETDRMCLCVLQAALLDVDWTDLSLQD